MQYLLTKEEYDKLLASQDAMEKRIRATVEARLSKYHEVLVKEVKELFRMIGNDTFVLGRSDSYQKHFLESAAKAREAMYSS